MERPWKNWRIKDCAESLKDLINDFYCIQPHPYSSLGAPYGANAHPFRLREGAFLRLLMANRLIESMHPEFSLAVFDAWRPIPVQAFMIDFSILAIDL